MSAKASRSTCVAKVNFVWGKRKTDFQKVSANASISWRSRSGDCNGESRGEMLQTALQQEHQAAYATIKTMSPTMKQAKLEVKKICLKNA